MSDERKLPTREMLDTFDCMLNTAKTAKSGDAAVGAWIKFSNAVGHAYPSLRFAAEERDRLAFDLVAYENKVAAEIALCANSATSPRRPRARRK